MKPKRQITRLFCIGLFFVLGLSMAVEGTEAAQRPSPAKHWPKILTITTSSEGTTGYAAAAALAKLTEERLGIPVTVTTSGSAEHIRVMARGEAEIGFTASDVIYQAYRGIVTYKKEGKQPVRYLTFAYPLVTWIFARGDISSFAELKGKRLKFQHQAPQYVAMLEPLLELHKMTRNDITFLNSSSGKETSNAVSAGTADAGLRSSGPQGAAALKDQAMTQKLSFVSLSDEEAKYILDKSPSLDVFTMPTGLYRGQSKPVVVTSANQNLVVHRDLPEDLVYQLAKILMDTCGIDTPGEFKKFNPNLAWTLQDNVKQLHRKVIPFHRGVVKYLKERGVWTDKMDGIQAELEALGK